jgi:hypothetical protein
MPWSQQNRLHLGPFHFNAMRLDRRIIFERVMHDAPIKRVERLQFYDIPPPADFLRSSLRLPNQFFARLPAIAGNVDHDFGTLLILLKKQPIEDVLQSNQGLSLPSNQSTRIVRLNIEQITLINSMLFDSRAKAEEAEQFFQSGFGLRRHICARVQRLPFLMILFPLLRSIRPNRRNQTLDGAAGLLIRGSGQLHLGNC